MQQQQAMIMERHLDNNLMGMSQVHPYYVKDFDDLSLTWGSPAMWV